jgi:hypothetical protein
LAAQSLSPKHCTQRFVDLSHTSSVLQSVEFWQVTKGTQALAMQSLLAGQSAAVKHAVHSPTLLSQMGWSPPSGPLAVVQPSELLQAVYVSQTLPTQC